jgi:hypothetical protein
MWNIPIKTPFGARDNGSDDPTKILFFHYPENSKKLTCKWLIIVLDFMFRQKLELFVS